MPRRSPRCTRSAETGQAGCPELIEWLDPRSSGHDMIDGCADRPSCGGCSTTGASIRARCCCPVGRRTPLAFFVNNAMDRVENYDTMDLALFRAEDVKRSLIDDGWKEDA